MPPSDKRPSFQLGSNETQCLIQIKSKSLPETRTIFLGFSKLGRVFSATRGVFDCHSWRNDSCLARDAARYPVDCKSAAETGPRCQGCQELKRNSRFSLKFHGAEGDRTPSCGLISERRQFQCRLLSLSKG